MELEEHMISVNRGEKSIATTPSRTTSNNDINDVADNNSIEKFSSLSFENLLLSPIVLSREGRMQQMLSRNTGDLMPFSPPAVAASPANQFQIEGVAIKAPLECLQLPPLESKNDHSAETEPPVLLHASVRSNSSQASGQGVNLDNDLSVSTLDENTSSYYSSDDTHIDEEVLNTSTHSAASASSQQREEEIQRTKEQIGQTSMAFIETIRGAAFRRKINLTKSRDDLHAKERKHRASIEAASVAKATFIVLKAPSATEEAKENKIPVRVFKAKPVPPTTGINGAGGLFGVPKIAKKPPTQPVSPRLGSLRRHSLQHLPPTQLPHQPQTDILHFRARPLPKTTGELGHGGLSGLPKISKRPTTAAVSPLLGSRRRDNNNELKKNSVRLSFQARPVPKTSSQYGHGGQSGIPKVPKRPPTDPRSPLLGLRRPAQQRISLADQRKFPSRIPAIPKRLLTVPNSRLVSIRRNVNSQPSPHPDISRSSSGSMQSKLLGVSLLSHENEDCSPAQHAAIQAYEPHSSRRAKKRSEYDAGRAVSEEERLERESAERLEMVESLKKEVRRLGRRL